MASPSRPARAARTDKEPPPYLLASVDHALRLAAMLQLEDRTTVTEAAARLGVAHSTAHRLLAMLVYRDFAAKEGRAYRVGPVLALASHSHASTGQLRTAALPFMEALAEQFDETVNLTIRTGATARFIASLEGQQVLRVGNRAGMVFPAHRVSGGLALLAERTDDEVRELYATAPAQPGAEPVDAEGVVSMVSRVRAQGFAINNEMSERGVLAIGVAVRERGGFPAGALSIALPASRFESSLLRPFVAALRQAARGVGEQLTGGGF